MKPVCSSLPQALILSASTQLKLTLSEIMKILVCHQSLRIFTLSNRAVHGSVPGRVCAQPGTDPPESGDKKMHPPPTAGVIGSDGSDHQRAAVGSVGVENPENRRENGENKPGKQRKSGQNL